MKITIEHNKLKREIRGTGFNICGSRDDLLRIADQIKEWADRNPAFGWVSIRDKQHDEHTSGPDSRPIPWANETKPTASQSPSGNKDSVTCYGCLGSGKRELRDYLYRKVGEEHCVVCDGSGYVPISSLCGSAPNRQPE